MRICLLAARPLSFFPAVYLYIVEYEILPHTLRPDPNKASVKQRGDAGILVAAALHLAGPSI